MAALAQAYPDDVDVLALAADAAVNITAWALWDTATGAPAPDSRVLEAKAYLDRALASDVGRAHPGVLHLYIHAMEMSAHPRTRCPPPTCCAGWCPTPGTCSTCRHTSTCCAASTAPGAGQPGGGAGRPPFRAARRPAELLLLYRAHDLHFVVYSAMFAGQSRIALQAADELSGQLTEELLSIPSRRWRTGSRPSFRCGCMC